jgi:hypothetical protein
LPDSLKGKCVPDFAKKIDLRVQDWETLPRSLRVTLKNEDVQAAANVYYTARFTAQVTVYQMKSRDAR